MSTPTENPQREDVVAGLDPPTDACITRPDMAHLADAGNVLKNYDDDGDYIGGQDLEALSTSIKHALTYIHHLEHQLTVAQNQNNLSLNTLRAERDALKEKVAKLEEELRDHEKTL